MLTRKLVLAAAFAVCTGLFVLPSSAAMFRVDNPSPAANAEFGTGVAGLGDQNGDGVPDFAVGVPGADRVDVFSGKDRTLIR
ncbi:MAG: integrin alpha, partial [Gemmatimonas sp.]